MEFKLLRKTHLIKLNFILISMLFFSSCYLIPCNLDSELEELDIKQEDDFFIGEYVIETNKNYQYKTDKILIEITKNENIYIKNIPSNVFYSSRPDEKLNIKGKWKLIYRDKAPFLSLNLKIKNKNLLTSWSIYIKRDKPVILIKIGDPDSCSAIRLIKK